ncbi:MAG: hypothetical protein ACLU9S_12140 [Oscillospiraceae bacterium]
MDNRRAIYIPFAQASAQGRDHRPRLLQHAQKRQVRRVRQGLHPPAPSITSRQDAARSSSEYGAIVAATGFNPIDLSKLRRVRLRPEPGRGLLPGV